jgi:hypothetical protein
MYDGTPLIVMARHAAGPQPGRLHAVLLLLAPDVAEPAHRRSKRLGTACSGYLEPRAVIWAHLDLLF